jgi:hypothetical protein
VEDLAELQRCVETSLSTERRTAQTVSAAPPAASERMKGIHDTVEARLCTNGNHREQEIDHPQQNDGDGRTQQRRRPVHYQRHKKEQHAVAQQGLRLVPAQAAAPDAQNAHCARTAQGSPSTRG